MIPPGAKNCSLVIAEAAPLATSLASVLKMILNGREKAKQKTKLTVKQFISMK
jgi:hypothetical protein